MEILTFLPLFIVVIVKSESHEWIERWAIKANDFQELARKFDEIYDVPKAIYDSREFGPLYSGAVTEMKLSEVGDILNGLVRLFMVQSLKHIGRHLTCFCDLVVQLIDKNTGDTYSDGAIRGRLRFPDDRVYCMITALHDAGIYTNVLFEATFFFRTIDRNAAYSIHDFKAMLRLYRKRFERYFKLPKKHQMPLPPNSSVDFIARRSDEVKQGLINFSNLFFPLWKPFVNHGYLAETVSDQVRNESRFIRYVFLNEKCTIDSSNKNQITGWREDYPPAFCDWILRWNCDNILKSQEYRFQEYEESVDPNKKSQKYRFQEYEDTVRPNKVARLFSSHTSPHSEREEFKTDMSLAELKDTLKPNKYYLNVLKYYNIVAESMLLVSIKEGGKIFKGIKRALQVSCCERNDEDNNNMLSAIRQLRPPLSMFKSAFDQFVAVMLYEKRISLEHNAQKREFDKRVTSLMRLLDVRGDVTRTRQYCDEILETLEHTDDAVASENPIGEIRFRNYYFDEPILHIGQLYRFVTFGFKYDAMAIVSE